MKRQIDLDNIVLREGGHQANDEYQMCVMEAVAYVAGEPWSDHPQCVSPVIAAFCRTWNDVSEPYGQEIRDRLRHYIPRLIGTAGDEAREERRAWLAIDWLIRVQTAIWLRAADLAKHADTLINLPPQTSREALRASAAANAAARAAANAAAWDTAWDALKPTIEELQASAWQLLDAMIACE